MEKVFSEQLSPIYQRNGRDCYLDLIRQKLIYITPEETVRQRVISYLINVLHIPAQEIISEQHLSHYGIKTKKRADIVIHATDVDGQAVPIAVVECKAPNVYLHFHDDEREAHHALQLVVEDNILVSGKKVSFYHHGKIAVGRQGSGKVDELRMFVEERYPKIISGKRFFLGSIVNDRLWRLDDPAVIEVIENMISYAIVRDEYREYVKKYRD